MQFRALRPGAGINLGLSLDEYFPLSENSKNKLIETVTEIFREELAESTTLQLTSDPGPDVLLVSVALLDIVSKIPPEQPGRNALYLDEVGSATLVMELRDSLSGETLARSLDRRAAEPMETLNLDGNRLSRVNAVTAWSDVRRVARRWALAVIRRIDQLHGDRPRK